MDCFSRRGPPCAGTGSGCPSPRPGSALDLRVNVPPISGGPARAVQAGGLDQLPLGLGHLVAGPWRSEGPSSGSTVGGPSRDAHSALATLTAGSSPFGRRSDTYRSWLDPGLWVWERRRFRFHGGRPFRSPLPSVSLYPGWTASLRFCVRFTPRRAEVLVTRAAHAGRAHTSGN